MGNLTSPALDGIVRWSAAGLLLGVTLAGNGCGENKPATSAERLNVLLISMDTTRADHLGCYGNPAIGTPHIDRLAAEGVRFENCISAAPITLPSHASMLTGLYPFAHCVRDNGTYRLPGEAETLAEVLSARGYATWAQVGAFVLHHSFGLDQGFDYYLDVEAVAAGEGEAEITADAVTDGAIGLLAGKPGEPFFLFVHYFDPHVPYRPPAEFAEQYSNRYAGEIAYVDQQIGRLLSALESTGVLDRTLIVLTADHGESLGEHGEDTHAYFVYRSTLRVPLIFWRPGRAPGNVEVSHTVRTIDIAPTILDVLGDPGSLSQAQGQSLVPLWKTGTMAREQPAYSETLYPKLNLGYAPLRSLEMGGWKYILAPTPELYDLRQDRAERRDLAAREPARAAQMDTELRNIVTQSPTVCGGGATPAPAGAPATLTALGYLGGAAPLAGGEAALFDLSAPNPMEMVDEIRRVNAAVPLIWSGDQAGVEQAMREILAAAGNRADGFAWAQGALATAIAAQGRFGEALPHAQAAADANPTDGRAWGLYALLLQQTGQIEAAASAYAEAVKHEPVAASVWLRYAQLCAAREEFARAAELFETALDADGGAYGDPDLVRMYIGILRKLDRNDAVEPVIERALQRTSDPAKRSIIEALRP